MSRPEFWKKYFMGMATYVSIASKDPSTQVGAVIVDYKHRVCGIGYNGFARCVHDDDRRLADRALKYKYVVHAEVNAVLNSKGGTEGCTLYCTSHPCSACASVIVQAGVFHVVCPAPVERWAEDATIAAVIFREAGVRLEIV